MAKYEKDQVLKGKVTGIQPFGAFVALDARLKVLSTSLKSHTTT